MIKKIFKLSILLFLLSCDNDKKVEPDIVDSRPEYKNRGDGYLKIRNYISESKFITDSLVLIIIYCFV